ncbi:MAG: NifU family protein, partial [Myxococcales bacterium]|nr:NifU family protein [Myxococcales bacterium]
MADMNYDKVQAVLDAHIRPVIEADGGEIELVDVADKLVILRLLGACGGCPGASFTQEGVI